MGRYSTINPNAQDEHGGNLLQTAISGDIVYFTNRGEDEQGYPKHDINAEKYLAILAAKGTGNRGRC